MIELRSDSFTQPTERMRRAMAEAPVGDDGYGEDPTVRALERLAADTLGHDDACLMPSGTMANLAAAMTHAPRGAAVVVGDDSDVHRFESDGFAVCGGLRYLPLPTDTAGRLPLPDLAAACAAERPRLICLENTHGLRGGAVLPPDHLAEVRAVADAHGIPVHLDGARLFHAAVALGVPVAALAGHAHSVQICLSKGLCAPVGSLLAGSTEFVAAARDVRRMLGGQMRQAGTLAAAGIVALTEMPSRIAEDHEHARLLAEGLAAIPGVALHTPQRTNIVFFTVPDGRIKHAELVARAHDAGVALAMRGGEGPIRAVLHAGVTRRDVTRAVAVIAGLIPDR